MKTTLAMMALATSLAVSGTAMAGSEMTRGHASLLASVSTHKPMQGFNRVVNDRRFVGYFLQSRDVCAVTVMVVGADDERLETPPQRVQVDIPAAGRSELLAGNGDALGIACTVDADAIKVAPLNARPTVSASK